MNNNHKPSRQKVRVTQLKLARLVASFKEKRSLKEARYRDLVKLALAAKETLSKNDSERPARFAARLREAKLERADILKIQRILDSGASEQFTAADKPMALQEVLSLAKPPGRGTGKIG